MKFNKEHHERLKPLEHYWITFKKSGTVLNIEPKDIDVIAGVQDECLGVKTNMSCNNCVAEAFKYVFIQFDKFIPDENIKNTEWVEVGREKRRRIPNQNRS